MRLIDADALKEIFDGSYCETSDQDVATIIDEQTTIAPVKHGKWIVIPQRCENQTFDECKCSVCGTVEYFNSGWKKFSYCPNCGSKMDGDADA